MRTENNYMQQPDEEKLWQYIDGQLADDEKAEIEQLLQTSPAWRNNYEELLEAHHLMQAADLEQPSMRFTKNIMDEIAKLQIAPAAKTYINKNIINGIGIFFLSLIAIFLVYGLSQMNWAAINTIQLPVKTDRLDNIDFGKFINNSWINIFMMVNVVLGLYFLDRVLAMKKKKIQREG